MQIRTLLTTALAVFVTVAGWGQETEYRLKQHVNYLASDELKGRKAGSPSAAQAAEYIKDQYIRIGIQPFFEKWEQDFEVNATEYTNIVGIIEGCDSSLKNEYILIGAHYDHLGVKDGVVYNGADDNASGSAALIEVARNLYQRRGELRRSVIIAAFDAEELGLYGSNKLAKRLSATDINVVMMMSLDMVGWYAKSKTLYLEGSSTLQGGDELLKRIAYENNIKIKTKDFETSLFTATDTEGFAKNGVPTLAVTTGTKSPYHKPEDDADRIDYAGLNLVTEYITDVTACMAGEELLMPSGKYALKHMPDPREKEKYAFDITAVAGLGSAYIDFNDAAFTGKTGGSYMAGAVGRIKLWFLKIHTGALVEYSTSPFPDLEDPLNKKTSFRQTALTVPATIDLISASEGPFKFSVGVGAYYSHTLGKPSVQGYAPLLASPNQTGVAFTFMMGYGRFSFGAYSFSQTNNLLGVDGYSPLVPSAPSTSLNRGYFTLGWRF